MAITINYSWQSAVAMETEDGWDDREKITFDVSVLKAEQAMN